MNTITRFLIIILLFITFFVQPAFSQTVRVIFTDDFDDLFENGQAWDEANSSTVESGIIDLLEDRFDDWDVSFSTSSGDIYLFIGSDIPLGYGKSNLSSYYCPWYYNHAWINTDTFAGYEEWQDDNATNDRIICGVGHTAAHELAHVFNLWHAFMFEAFDPSGTDALNPDNNPKDPYWSPKLPPALMADSTAAFQHIMATLSYITRPQRAEVDRHWSTYNSEPTLDFQFGDLTNIRINSLIWAMTNNEDHRLAYLLLQQDISIGDGNTLIVSEGLDSPNGKSKIDLGYHKITTSGSGDIDLYGIILHDMDPTVNDPDYFYFDSGYGDSPVQWTVSIQGGHPTYTYEWDIRENGGNWQDMSDTGSSVSLDSEELETEYSINLNDDSFDLKVWVTESLPPWGDDQLSKYDIKTVDLLTFPVAGIDGDDEVEVGTYATWYEDASGGQAPYSYQWWWKVGEFGTWWSGGTGSSFQLYIDADYAPLMYVKLEVTDDHDKTDDETMEIEVSGEGKISGKSPTTFKLEQNYPNPFNPVTTIRYQLPKPADVTLVIYDISGKEVARLVDGPRGPGYHSEEWSASDVASGVYIYKLTAGDFTDIKRMILVK
ncbi:T9SS type A sorting domain-containing protein [candidate division KSB1 bacterium]